MAEQFDESPYRKAARRFCDEYVLLNLPFELVLAAMLEGAEIAIKEATEEIRHDRNE